MVERSFVLGEVHLARQGTALSSLAEGGLEKNPRASHVLFPPVRRQWLDLPLFHFAWRA